MIVHKLFDGEDQSHGGGAIVVCSAYGSGAVGLEEVLVTGKLRRRGLWRDREPIGDEIL